MAIANVVEMTARPSSVTHLCFEIGGVLDTRVAQLGDSPNPIAYRKLCEQFQGTVAGDPSRLKGDSGGVQGVVAGHVLASLRNEDRKAALDSAVKTRQNIYFSKYAGAPQIISTIRGYYARTSAASKPNLLGILDNLAEQQLEALQGAYTDDDRTGVVKATTTCTDSGGNSGGSATRKSKFYQESVGRDLPGNAPQPQIPDPVGGIAPDAISGGYPSMTFTTSSETSSAVTAGVNYEETTNSGTSSGSQQSKHYDYEYRTPYIEAQARTLRAHVSLMDQQFQSYMFEQNIPHLEQVFDNELSNVDSDVYSLQVAYLRSYLFSPVAGVVTGVYKYPGDAVNAGEPVLRVEDNSTILLVATLVHYGQIALGAAASVSTTLDGAGQPQTVRTGSVVAARGQAPGGRWNVVMQIDNLDGAGNPVIPLGHCFDPEFTTVTIS